MKSNIDIRRHAELRGVRLWQIVDVLGISDSNFSRKLRHELGGREKAKIIKIIDRIADAERRRQFR